MDSGGNFQFYTWVLKEEFPNAVILAPSWGMDWRSGSATYLKDMLADAERRVGIRLRKPWLMAISAGGYGGFSLYNQMSATFSGYVCLAATPGDNCRRTASPGYESLDTQWKDRYDASDCCCQETGGIGQAITFRRSLQKKIEGDHFFLLSKRNETFNAHPGVHGQVKCCGKLGTALEGRLTIHVFNRPFGRANFFSVFQPNDESLGYCHTTLRVGKTLTCV